MSDPASLDAELAAFATAHPGTSLTRKTSAAPPALVVVVDGDLDTSDSPDFLKAALAALYEAKKDGGLIIDLAALRYASSTGVGALTSTLIEAKKSDIPFYLCGISKRVMSVFEVLGFSSFFTFIERYEEPL